MITKLLTSSIGLIISIVGMGVISSTTKSLELDTSIPATSKDFIGYLQFIS